MEINQIILSYLQKIDDEIITPFYLYDEVGILETCRSINRCFEWTGRYTDNTYQNFFAVKALPNPEILKILKREGMGADASSGPELELAKMAGITGENIIFTSNNTAIEEYIEAINLGAVVNLDDINQLKLLISKLDNPPNILSFRYNPGKIKSSGVNKIIGLPEDAKFGLTRKQMFEAYKLAKEWGVNRFGIHTMVVSNELDVSSHRQTAEIIFELAVEIYNELGIEFEFINLGGGLGIPYRPDQNSINYEELSTNLDAAFQIIVLSGMKIPRIITEYGRHITGPHGYLVTKVRSIKETYHRYVGLDSSMAHMMRPGMYDAYHHITVLNADERPLVNQRVVGSLCENNDYFTGSETKDRILPLMQPGDTVLIHDAGAHGHAMGFNYNGLLRCAEYLLQADGASRMIRRAETRQDLFATLV